MEQLGSYWTRFKEIWYEYLSKICRENSNKNDGYFTWRPKYIFHRILSVILRMRNVCDSVVEKFKTHILCSVTFFFRKLCRLWDNVENTVEPGRSQMAIWRRRIACWTPTSINTHSQCVIIIVSSLQQWLHERRSVLRYTDLACLFHIKIVHARNMQEWICTFILHVVINGCVSSARIFHIKTNTTHLYIYMFDRYSVQDLNPHASPSKQTSLVSFPTMTIK